jgi:hypothetical protein
MSANFYDAYCFVWFAVLWLFLMGVGLPDATLFEIGVWVAIVNFLLGCLLL